MDDKLSTLVRDAHVLRASVFKLFHGDNVYRYFAPDNSVRLYSVFKEPIVPPLVKKRSEHKTSPRRNDKVMVVDGDEVRHGHVLWVGENDDSIGVFMYDVKRWENFSLDTLESNSGRIRWRIVV